MAGDAWALARGDPDYPVWALTANIPQEKPPPRDLALSTSHTAAGTAAAHCPLAGYQRTRASASAWLNAAAFRPSRAQTLVYSKKHAAVRFTPSYRQKQFELTSRCGVVKPPPLSSQHSRDGCVWCRPDLAIWTEHPSDALHSRSATQCAHLLWARCRRVAVNSTPACTLQDASRFRFADPCACGADLRTSSSRTSRIVTNVRTAGPRPEPGEPSSEPDQQQRLHAEQPWVVSRTSRS